MKELDTVTLLHEYTDVFERRPHHTMIVHLHPGAIGTIIDVYEGGKAFLVEFSDDDGCTLGMPVVVAEHLELHTSHTPIDENTLRGYMNL